MTIIIVITATILVIILINVKLKLDIMIIITNIITNLCGFINFIDFSQLPIKICFHYFKQIFLSFEVVLQLPFPFIYLVVKKYLDYFLLHIQLFHQVLFLDLSLIILSFHN